MKRFLYTQLITILSTGCLMAQEAWNLDRCISFAINNNIGLRKANVQVDLASEDFRQSKRNLLPGIAATSNARVNFGRSVDPNTNDITNNEFFNNTYDIGASLTLFNGFKQLNQIGYQKYKMRAIELNRISATDDLAFNIMNDYFDVLFYQGLLKIASDQVEASRMNLKKMQRQVDLGMKSKPDLLEMQANFESEELRRIQIENNLQTSMLQLKQKMNLSDTSSMIIEDEYSTVTLCDKPVTDSLFHTYLQWSPYYQSFEAQFNASQKHLAISRAQTYPSINAYGSVGSGYFETTKDASGKTVGFKTQIDNGLNQFVGIEIRIPLFSRGVTRSEIKKAKLSLVQAQNTLDDEKQKLYFNLINDLNELQALEKEYDQYKRQQDADRQAYHAAEIKFEQGLINVVDFYIAKNRLANTDSRMLKARLNWEVKKNTIDFYNGIRFWEQ